MRKGILMGLMWLSSTAGAIAPVEAKDYWEPLSESDQKNIRFVMNALAKKSLFSLLFQREEIDEAEREVSHVHPLRFFCFVLTDSQLRWDMKALKGAPRKRFYQDFSENLAQAKKEGGMGEELLKDFSQAVGLPFDPIQDYVEQEAWVPFLRFLSREVR